MPTAWPQTTFGKLVTAPNGPIRPGCDYERTGATDGFPNDLLKDCRPEALGVGNLQLWSQYPWVGRPGPLILRPVRTAVGWYYAAGRIHPRIEEPRDGRYYAETQHAVAPVSAVPFADLFDLPRVLTAAPLTAIDRQLPLLRVGRDDPTPLPAGWFDRVRPLLAAVTAGRRWTTTARDHGPDTFFDLALLCLACLPATLRWRVPVGAGLYDVPAPGAGGIGFGLVSGFRNPAGADREPGPAPYAEWVEDAARAARTVEDLLRAVDDRLPDQRDWDAVAPDLPWGQAVRVLDEIRVLRRLSGWLADPAPADDLDLAGVDRFRKDVVREVVSAVVRGAPGAGRGLARIAGPGWAAAWDDAAVPPDPLGRTIRALAGLIGASGDPDPDLLAQADRFDLPGPADLTRVAADRLATALDRCRVDDLPRWARLLSRAGSVDRPNWLARWWVADADRIAWRAVTLYRARRTTAHVNDWDRNGPGAPAAVRRALLGEEPEPRAFRALCATVEGADRATRDNALALSVELRGRESWPEALALAARAAAGPGADNWLTTELGVEYLLGLNPAQRAHLAGRLARAVRDYGRAPLLLLGLTALWDALPLAHRADLTPPLLDFLGRPLATLLIDASPHVGSPTRADELVIQAAGAAALLSPPRLNRLFQAAPADRHDPLGPDFLVRLLAVLGDRVDLTVPADVSPVLRFVAEARTRPPAYPRRLSEDDRRLARALCKALPPPRTRPAPVTSADQFPAVLAFARWFGDPPDVAPGAWADLLKKSLDERDTRERWRDWLKEVGWADRPVWRLPGWWRQLTELTADEEDLVASLPDAVVVWAAISGAPMSDRLAGRLTARALTESRLPADFVGQLIDLGSGPVTYEVLKHAWARTASLPGGLDLVWERLRGWRLPRLRGARPPESWADVLLRTIETLAIPRERLDEWVRSGQGPPPALKWRKVPGADGAH